MDYRMPLGDWIEEGVNWARENLDWLFGALRQLFIWMFDGLNWLLSTPHAYVLIAIKIGRAHV